jgi:hypothetical protein
MADAYCLKHGPFNYRRIWSGPAKSILIETCELCDKEMDGQEVQCPHCGKLFSKIPPSVNQGTGQPEMQALDLSKAVPEKPGERPEPESEKPKRQMATVDGVLEDRNPGGGSGDLGDEDFVAPDAPDV